MLAIDSSYIYFIMVRYTHCIHRFTTAFSGKNVEFSQRLFVHLFRWSCAFVFTCIYMLYYIYWFEYGEQSLHPINEAYLNIGYDIFHRLLNLVSEYITLISYVYVLQNSWPVTSFVMFLSCFGMSIILAWHNEFCSIPFLSISWTCLKIVGINSS
jgi:hypothetical protein